MGFKFRKSIKIAPGIKVNLSSKGVTSTSIGGKGVTLNVGSKKGSKLTTSLKGTGLSHTQQLTKNKPQSHEPYNAQARSNPSQQYESPRAKALKNLAQFDHPKPSFSAKKFWLVIVILFVIAFYMSR
jgi:hypothetical protein